MSLTLMFRVVYYASPVFILAAFGVSAPAAVITTGDVDPGGAGTQVGPWEVGGDLYVAHHGSGELNVTDGGVVSNTNGFIGASSGATGEVTVTGSGSQWNNSETLGVGKYGTGTLNVEAGGVVSNKFGNIGSEAPAPHDPRRFRPENDLPALFTKTCPDVPENPGPAI